MRGVLSIIGLLCSINFVIAQSLVITGDTYFTGSAVDQITHHLDVKNISNKGITVVCQKTYISTPPSLPAWAGASYCFAGNCYSSSSTTPSSTALLGSGQSFSYANSDQDAFSGYYDPASTPGITMVEYCFYDEINPSDNTCVTITYEVGSASALNEINEMISDFYPNPAQDVINFKYFSNESSTLIIMDILGNTLQELDINQKRVYKLDVENLPKGIYFANLILGNEVLAIKKLIVK